MVSVDVLRAAMPRCPAPAAWAAALSDACMRFMLTDPDEVAMLLAQVGHESADLTRLVESLNYSPERLIAVWPSRFRSLEAAKAFARNPEALANVVYANRMGNGDTASGDGWKYRGRGPLQLTGRNNYAALEEATGWPVTVFPDLVAGDLRIGAASACWFWKKHVRMGSIQSVTRQINGGLHGLEDRIARLEAAQAAMDKVA